MSWLRAVGITLLVLMGSTTTAETSGALADSQDSALSWLALIDNGEIHRSWSEASSLFQQAVTAADWERALQGARGPLGEFQARSFLGATHTTTLPGAPDGEYVVMQFEASFARKAEAVETVTTMLEADGSWRVSGYFIR